MQPVASRVALCHRAALRPCSLRAARTGDWREADLGERHRSEDGAGVDGLKAELRGNQREEWSEECFGAVESHHLEAYHDDEAVTGHLHDMLVFLVWSVHYAGVLSSLRTQRSISGGVVWG